MTLLRAQQSDITTLQLDAIVNAANRSLRGGGGVDGAIHRAAGPELLQACIELGGCDIGEAKLTPGFRLPSRYVIHTVGPVWSGGQRREATLLASCYRSCLELAHGHALHSIAFPCISTGVYGYPAESAATTAIGTVSTWIQQHTTAFTEIVFCCFSLQDLKIYRRSLGPVAR